MIFEEMLREEHAEGLAEGLAQGKAQAQARCILTLLKKRGKISEYLRSKILNETDLVTLERWFQQAVESASIEEFLEKM